MRIVVVSWRDLANPLAGGSEVVVDRILTELQSMGHDVALVCGGPVGARPYPVTRAGGTFSQYLVAPWKCRRRYRGWDLLIDIENGLPFFSPLWWKGPRVCLVHHIHTDQWATRFGPLAAAVGSWAERVAMPAVYRRELFVAISESTADGLAEIGIARKKIRTVHSGIDLPALDGGFTGPESDQPLFLMVGRLVPHKRVELVLKVWESVRPVVGGRLVITGDGPERGALERLAGVGVEFVGRVDSSRRNDLMKQAWFLIHAAHHEGWGMVIAEAAGFGTPCVALDVLGVRDVIADGQTGILAASVEDLGRQWIELAKNPSLRQTMGRKARRRAESFSWPAMVNQLLGIAAEAMG